MEFNRDPSDEPHITLADLKSALFVARARANNHLIAELGRLGGLSDAFDRDRWMCELGRYAAIENGIKFIRNLETAAKRPCVEKRPGGAE